MKIKISVLLLASIFTINSFSQPADTALLRQEMEKLSWMLGTWEGQAKIQRGPGQPLIVNQVETVQSRLDGLLLIIEGIGKYRDPDSQTEKVGHHAFALITYDPQKSQYRFQSYLNTGQQGDSYLKIVGENQYEWGFEGRVKYLITYTPSEKSWKETGEYSPDNGTTWTQFIEMELKKLN